MLQSSLFPKCKKEAPRGAESVNHKLLVRAGFVDQLMAGSWTLCPLGFRVIEKINQIIREELNAIGAQEMLMPLLHPKNVWQETGRWDKADEILYKIVDKRKKEYTLAFTHEEIVMDLLRKEIVSYQDLPVYLYHFSTKFRNEARARSGILRGREFLMKDLYSAHTSEKDLMDYYEKVKESYLKIFQRLGFSVRVTEASGGVFTDQVTHEFQVIAKGGEDAIFYCNLCDWGENKEIYQGKKGDSCPRCKRGKVIAANSIEVGNIFPLGTWFSERMKTYFIDKEGKKRPIWFGSYGIGPTRTMGAWVEVSHDEKGIIWNKTISPFSVHLLSLEKDKQAREVYEKLVSSGIDVLFDDRSLSAGEKFTDCDLIGIPARLVVSEKTKDKIEYKQRDGEKVELLSYEEVMRRI